MMNKDLNHVIKKNKYRAQFYQKYKKKKNNNFTLNNSVFVKLINRVLISVILLFSLLICKKEDNLYFIYDKTFTNINFMKVDKFITNIYGGLFPIPQNNNKYVNAGVINTNNSIKYEDGLLISEPIFFAVSSHTDGIVIRLYQDKKFSNVVVIQDIEGNTYHYGLLDDVKVNLYSKVYYGDIIGVAKTSSNLDKSQYYLAIYNKEKNLDVIKVINDES